VSENLLSCHGMMQRYLVLILLSDKIDRDEGVKVKKKIGEGVYGEVYRATHAGQCVALKVCRSHKLTCTVN